jgi:hypothetical protein
VLGRQALDRRAVRRLKGIGRALPLVRDRDQRLGQLAEVERRRDRPLPEVDGTRVSEPFDRPPGAIRELDLDVPMEECHPLPVGGDDGVGAADAALEADGRPRQLVGSGTVRAPASRRPARVSAPLQRTSSAPSPMPTIPMAIRRRGIVAALTAGEYAVRAR